MLYFVLDFIWIIIDQNCVKSATPLAIHHVVSAVYAFLPYFYPDVAIKMSLVMTVEVRTHLQANVASRTPYMPFLKHACIWQ